MEITLKEYAEKHGKNPATVRQKALRGGFKTARRVGRDWVIDADEPYIRQSKKLKAADVFTAEADTLTPDDRRIILKLEQAKEYSGWRHHPDTCNAIFSQIPDEWYNRYTAKQLGEIAALLKVVYDKGRSDAQQK